MTTYRLYTRAQDLHLLQQCFVALDLTLKDFRSIPLLDHYVKYWFVDVDDLLEFLLLKGLNQRITLIVSDLLANIAYHYLRGMFPQIVRIVTIGSRSCRWESVDHFSNVQLLVEHLSLSLRDRQRLYITFDSWPVERTSHDLNKHTAKYIWYSYFYTILSRLNHTDVARAEMLESIKVFHTKQIDVVRRSCEEFEQTYKSTDIIRWYTKESFFYLLLNRTLRSEDINHIFSMRYVISDLDNYLRRNCSGNLAIDTVYRGQQMHLSEIQEIESNMNGLIGLTAFWSTSCSKTIAMRFAEIWPQKRSDPVEIVFFTIKIPSTATKAVYLDITEFSRYESEFEIVFSFRSLFRVERVMRNGNDRYWHVNLTLIDEDDEQFISIMHPWYSSASDIIGDRCFFTPPLTQSKQNFFRNMTLDNGPFLAFQLLIDMMLRLDQNDRARTELFQVCREYCYNEPINLKQIDEFERTYNPKDVIKWYTKDCFLYRLINHSLRIKSVDLIFKLRYFIHDLHNQLAEMQTDFLRHARTNGLSLQLYRGLQMSFHELHELQENSGNLVSTSSFLSTTNDYVAASFFAGDGNVDDGMVSVIYKITVDMTCEHQIAFAEISYKSIHKDENEVLFTMGAVFRIGEIEQIRDRLWTVELTLTSTENEQWNILTDHLNSK